MEVIIFTGAIKVCL